MSSYDDPYEYKKQEQQRPRRLSPFARLLIAALILAAPFILYSWATQPDPAPASTGQGDVNITVNSGQPQFTIPQGIQVVHFTGFVPSLIGRRFLHDNQLMTPAPCSATDVCAFKMLPHQTDHNYCIYYHYYDMRECISVDPYQSYVVINARD